MTVVASKIPDAILRRNIWRSMLIMKSVQLSELPAVVSGLNVRKARSLMRDLWAHGYVSKAFRGGRQEYSRAIDTPSLPAVCKNCGRGFEAKACTPIVEKTETETETEGKRQRKKKRNRNRQSPAQVTARAIREVTNDTA
jgi:hypothetical protein